MAPATASGTFQPVANASQLGGFPAQPEPAAQPPSMTASGTYPTASQPIQAVTQNPSASGSFPASAPAAFPPPTALQADITANPFASAHQAQSQAMSPPGFETAPGTPATDPAAAPAAPGEGEEDEETVRDINDALRGLFR
ncbi:MAG: hypothetical protein C0469_16195 [Cyanobacteria bacterium DS2.3.42]|nr:hypothetical protein [Cyanobacteria bacterium DS2.3.42]